MTSGASHPTTCEQCEQLFGAVDRYLPGQEVIVRSCRYTKNPQTGQRDVPAMAECYPCEAGLDQFAYYSRSYITMTM